MRNSTREPFSEVLIAYIDIPDHGIRIWQQPRTVASWPEDCGRGEICLNPSPGDCCEDVRWRTGNSMQYSDFAAHPLPPGEGSDYLVSFTGYGFGIRPNIHVACIEESLRSAYGPLEQFSACCPSTEGPARLRRPPDLDPGAGAGRRWLPCVGPRRHDGS